MNRNAVTTSHAPTTSTKASAAMPVHVSRHVMGLTDIPRSMRSRTLRAGLAIQGAFYPLLRLPWSQEGFLNGPSSVEPALNCGSAQADKSGPFCDGPSLAATRKMSRVSLVPSLLLFGGPAAIARLVISVGVVALNRVLRARLGAHVREEVLERIDPAIANLYPAAAVVLVPRPLRVQTPSFDVRPAGPFWSEAPAMGARVRANNLVSQAPATMRLAAQAVGNDNCFVAAIASASPKDTPAFSKKTNGCETAELLAGVVFRFTAGHTTQFYQMRAA